MLFKPLALAALASAASAQSISNLIGTLYTTPDLSNLSSYLGMYPSFAGQLSQLSNITILAPSNEAFAKLSNTSINATDSAGIAALLNYHILNGTYLATDFTNQSAFIPTALVDPAYTNVTGGQVVQAVISSERNITFTSGLFTQSNLTNASMSMNFTGGVIHIVDTVLKIPESLNMTAIATNLTSAVGVLNRTSLLSAVDDMSDITGFIPNNAAFRRVSDALIDLSDAELGSILEYHLVNATGFPTISASTSNMTNATRSNATASAPFTIGYSENLSNMTLTSVAGMNLTITRINNSTIFVNGARILTPNVLIGNGVYHIIDNVLNPSNTTIVPVATGTASQVAQFSTDATSTSEEPFTSGVPTPTSTIPAYITNTDTVTVTNTVVSSTPVSGHSASSSAMAPIQTGAMGAAALFGGAVVIMNL